MSSDKFCGNCGAAVFSPPPQAEQVIPKPVAQQAAPPVGRLKWLFAAMGVLLVPVLILVVSISSKASGDTELTSGVRSTVPGGWIAQDGVSPGRTDLIPESYRDTDLDTIDTLIDDPFQGELEDNAFEVAESFDTEEPEEEITPMEDDSSDESVTPEDFVFEYYDAVEQEDWEATYSMLAEASQEEFTEEEWVEVQEIRQATEGAPAPLESVEIEVDEEQIDPPAIATLTFEDETTSTITLIYSLDSQEPRRLLAEEDISYLENLAVDNEDSGDESAAVEEAVRGHYGAIGDRSFYEAYSYFGPTFRNTVSEETWVEEEESFDIQSSTIYSVEVSEVSEDTATATVDVGFEDNTGSPRFTITWNLVQEDGEWKLDEVSSSEQMDSSDEVEEQQNMPEFDELLPEDTNGGAGGEI